MSTRRLLGLLEHNRDWILDKAPLQSIGFYKYYHSRMIATINSKVLLLSPSEGGIVFTTEWTKAIQSSLNAQYVLYPFEFICYILTNLIQTVHVQFEAEVCCVRYP